MEPYQLSAVQLVEAVQNGQLTVDDIISFYQSRVQSYSPTLNTHCDFETQQVDAQVDAIKQRLAKGEVLPLAGLPVLVKDNISTKDQPTTCASQMLDGYRPIYDAHVVELLRRKGALIFGKANMDEFAMGSSNEYSHQGVVRNPWHQEYVPGGSSGGSAAAVAADLAPVALGSDTGGSIRQPASFCGVVGLKPTYGRVSRYGLVAFGSSLDQIGPLARSVEDAALLLNGIAGFDERDSTAVNRAVPDYVASLKTTPFRGRIGVVREFFDEGLDPEVKKQLDQALQTYRDLGCELVDLSIPSLKYSVAAYYVIAPAEASANLARFDGVRFGHRDLDAPNQLSELYARTRSQGFGREVKQRIMLGTFALSSGYYDAYYGKATKVRAQIMRDFSKAFESVDLIVSPTSPTPCFKIGSQVDDPLSMYLNDICTIGANLAKLPGISVPCGLDTNGLPVGMQLLAPWWEEERLLKGAYAYEQAAKWNEHPSL